jgi:hypothetical protein
LVLRLGEFEHDPTYKSGNSHQAGQEIGLSRILAGTLENSDLKQLYDSSLSRFPGKN